jgi:hypothetical protein
LEDWQLALSRDDAIAGDFSGPNAPDSVALAIHPIDIHVGIQRWQATGPPGSTLVVLMASTKDHRAFQAFNSALLAERLAIMAVALFVIQRISLVVSSLPFRLLETVWQQRFISACLDSATITLIALGLIHLSIAFAVGARHKGKDVPLLVGRHTMLIIRAPRAWILTAGGLRGLPLPGPLSLLRKRVVPGSCPADDSTSETGVPPPPPWDLACRPPGWHPPGKGMVAALYSQWLQIGCRFAEMLNVA